MQNRSLKADLVRNGKYKQFTDLRNKNFINGLDLLDYSLYSDFLSITEFESCCQLVDAKRKQRNKVKKWLVYWLSRDDVKVCFLTLTFNNSTLNKSFSARKQIINRTLSSNFLDYVSNVDYGSLNEREHYHALVVLSLDEFDLINWTKSKRGCYCSDFLLLEQYGKKYGFYNMQPINIKDDRSDLADHINKLAGYIAKLVNHSIKIKQTKLGYKRNSDYQFFKKALADRDDASKFTRFFSSQLLDFINYPVDNVKIMRWLNDPLT